MDESRIYKVSSQGVHNNRMLCAYVGIYIYFCVFVIVCANILGSIRIHAYKYQNKLKNTETVR